MAAKQTDAFTKSQEQLFDLYKQSQDAFVKGLETWAKAAKDMTEATTSMVDTKTFESAIDQTFAAASKALEQQRDFLKKLHSATNEASDAAA